MASLAFYAAPVDQDTSINDPIDQTRATRTHNKTIKRTTDVNTKVENMRKHLSVQGIDTSQSQLGDFNPPDMPESAGTERTRDREEDIVVEPNTFHNTDAPVNVENFNTLPEPSQEYYIPYYDSPNDNGNRNVIIHKLDYMIHLLEEQKEQKTDSATEEIILYSFLGIFIIFVLDSFARAGKYTR